MVGKIGTAWEAENFKPILAEIQGVIYTLSDLMEYLAKNLPMKNKAWSSLSLILRIARYFG